MTLPEPSLLPPELPPPPLRCRLCSRPVPEALELFAGPVCRACLARAAAGGSLDDLSALLCAAILTDSDHSQRR